jgi:Tol biopolymer transport system component
LIKDGVINKIAAKITYTAWHPSGKMLTFSANDVRQFFHSANNEVRNAVDMASMIAYYLVDSNEIKKHEAFSSKEMLETYPSWSPDGKYLYFCKARRTWGEDSDVPPTGFQNIKYDLVRISYDIEKDQWGQVETVISAKDNLSSNLLPRISPDGRWLLYCQCSYGCFPAFSKSSDLYLVDLSEPKVDGKYRSRRLDINSDESDAYHSFSSNSRWIVFSSKRAGGPFTRPYICGIDEQGNTTKPFILPQKDPIFLDRCMDTYTVPVLAVEPVGVKANALAKIIRSAESLDVDIPVSMASPKVAGDQKEYLQVQE